MTASGRRRYDIIVSNPPYVSARRDAPPAARVPRGAASRLRAADRGLAIVERILAGAEAPPDGRRGILVVEVGNTEPRAAARAFRELPFTWLEFERGGAVVFLLRAADLPALIRMSGNTFGTLVHRHDLRREPRARARRHRRRLPAGARDSPRRTSRRTSTRRRTGTSQFTSQRQEPDQVRILSGVFEGRTTGTPIGLLVENADARSRDYEKIKDRFRPGHADYTYQQKYGFRDYRGGGRSSARETVATVAAGAIARKYLRERLGLDGRRLPIADRSASPRAARTSPRRARIRSSARIRHACRELEDYLKQLRRDGDSIGATVTVQARRACRRGSASRCSTGSTPTSRTR